MQTERSHSPEWALYAGLEDGVHKYLIESASEPGRWYTVIVPRDGSAAICECPAWVHHGHCGMTDASGHLLAIGEVADLLLELVGMAYELQLKIQADGTYKLSDDEVYHARRLTRQADQLLEKLGTHGA